MAAQAELSLIAAGDNEKNVSGDKASKVSSTGSYEDELAMGHMASIQDLQLDGLDPIYEAKVHALNQAMQDIGMGRYQWLLFCLTGFGWMADNVRGHNSAYSMTSSLTRVGRCGNNALRSYSPRSHSNLTPTSQTFSASANR